MDKIIERAKEYADRHQDAELNHFGLGRTYGYQRIYNAELTAYERGAKEQKAIDNAKAKEAFNKVCGWLSTYSWFNKVVDEFIKALEE